MSSANLVEVIFVEEVTYDVTPTDSTDWESLRFTSEALSATPTTNQSEEIRSDRMIADQFKVSVDVGGGLDYEFSATTYDGLLEGTMYDTWSTGVLKVGVEEHSYTLEKTFSDLTANHFMTFSGMRVGEMAIGFSYGEAVSGTFTMAGASVVGASTSLVGAGTVAPATTTRVMNAVSDLSEIKIDDTTFTGCLQSVNLSVNNNLRAANCIGSDTPSDQIAGTAEITGSIEAYLTDTTIQWYTDRVLNQTPMAISFTISDGTTSYNFNIPNAKITGEAPQAEGINTDVMITADFTALYDDTTGSSLVITRTP